MEIRYRQLTKYLSVTPYNWLITGVAGFIGSHLLEQLLELNQYVTGLDNFSTGYQSNLDQVKHHVGSNKWQNFRLITSNITNYEDCQRAAKDVDFVLHQAALGAVPRSIAEPLLTNKHNVDGFLNMLFAAKNAKVKAFIYASSSSVYGDNLDLIKIENKLGNPLSPYAASKQANEIYAKAFSNSYGLSCIGLRYFNVFGPRQDPLGAYAAVIPRWIYKLLNHETIEIYGDGTTSRDFCYVANVVQANLLAAFPLNPLSNSKIYNVALNQRTSLNELLTKIETILCRKLGRTPFMSKPVYKEHRPGDIYLSQANISKICTELGYAPEVDINSGLEKTIDYFLQIYS